MMAARASEVHSRAGELVSRDDIQHELWGRDTFVDFEQGVNHCIKELRAALGDAAEVPRYIQRPRRGNSASVERIGVDQRTSRMDRRLRHRQAGAEPSSPVAESAGTLAVTSRPDGTRPYTRRAWLVAAGAAMLMAGAFVASRAAWPRSPTPHASAIVVHSFSAPNDPALGVGLFECDLGQTRSPATPLDPINGPQRRRIGEPRPGSE